MSVPSKVFLTALLAAAGAAHAQTVWLTVIGDSADASQTTIQIDPVPVSVSSDARVMKVRVSRPSARTSMDGVKFQSFASRVLFECRQKSARFVEAEFFAQPLWAGPSHASLKYGPATIRPMAFRDIEPNPAPQIIRAACGAEPARI